MKLTIKLALLAFVSSPATQAATILEVDFSHLNPGDTIGDAVRIQDISGNRYHGFWGDVSGSRTIVTTFNGGVGVDTSSSTRPGHVFHRDNLTDGGAGSPNAWWGTGNTPTPYFTLDGGTTGTFTMEAVVNWNGTTSSRNGLMGQTGGNEVWLRESGGFIQYAIVGNGKNANMFTNTIDISAAKADGLYHNVSLVYDGPAGEIRTYLDGSLIHTNDDADIGDLGTMLNGTSDFRTGAYNTTDSDAFNGIQDHYRISDTALTPSEFLAVPEPSSLGLLGGLLGLGLLCRRR